ncbi:hypothetical protein [Streptomyces celluloflavus]|uniref:hypothetical protein n=1 Tax=Streptomyces celluloflavus TaxID=58344 RepID=UPI0036A8D943
MWTLPHPIRASAHPMRALPHPHTGEGAAVLGLLTLALLGTVLLGTAPLRDRPVAGGALAAVGVSVFLVVAALWHHYHRAAARRARPTAPAAVDGRWFTAESLEGFPGRLAGPSRGPGAPDRDRLYLAWILATQGHDAAWIGHRLGLPAEVVHPLVDAARERR